MRTTEYDLSNAHWRRSTYSGPEGGSCVEVAGGFGGGVIPVRDSKAPHGPALVFGVGAWGAFVAGVKSGRVG